MIRKLLKALRKHRRKEHPATRLLHCAVPRARPPKGLLNRIETQLDVSVQRRQDWHRKLLALSTTAGFLTLVGFIALLIQPEEHLIVDAMGKQVARIELMQSGYSVHVQSLKPLDKGTYHLWAVAPSGETKHLAALTSSLRVVSSLPVAKKFAISLENPEFSGSHPVGPVIAVSQCENFFCRVLHPK